MSDDARVDGSVQVSEGFERAAKALLRTQTALAVAASPQATLDERRTAIALASAALDEAAPIFDRCFDEMEAVMKRAGAATGHDVTPNLLAVARRRETMRTSLAAERAKLDALAKSLEL